jgi:hypothetical protein
MMTTYTSALAREIQAAQADLEAHAVSSVGRCMTCGSDGSCLVRETAMRVFRDREVLPRRRPGHTRPELSLTGYRRVDMPRRS